MFDLIECFGEQIHTCISGNWHIDQEFINDYVQEFNKDEDEIKSSLYENFKKHMIDKYGEDSFPYFDNMYDFAFTNLIAYEETMILSNKKLYDFDKVHAGKLSRKKKALYNKLKDYLSNLFTFSFDYSMTCRKGNKSYRWIWSTGYACDIDDSVTYLHISFAALVSYILIDKFIKEMEKK